jgi:hypothetical protein
MLDRGAVASWRALAAAVLAVAVVVAVVAAPRVGLSWDEEHSAQNGEYAAAWYRTLGRDQRVLTSFNQRFYGSAFNLTSHLAARVSPLGSYETGHLLIALTGCVALLFTYRLGRLVGGERAGFFALLVLALTPPFVGHAFMNPKDIPLAALFVAGAYYVARAMSELPRPSRATLVGLGVATGLAAGVRVIGIFLVGYWGIALAVWTALALVRGSPRPGWLTLAGYWWKPALAAWTIMVLCWPFAQLDPVRNPVRAFLDNAAFQFQGAMRFAGASISPQGLPPTYLPTWFAISLPEVYLIGLAGGVVPTFAFLLGEGRGRRWRGIAAVVCLLIATLLPPALAVWRRAVMYDGMRHFLFVVPFAAVLAGWGLAAAVGDVTAVRTRRTFFAWLRGAIGLVIASAGVASLGLTLADMWALHPYEYIYFNRLGGGGQAAASERFETDYWGLSYKEGLAWLRDNYPAASRPVPVANCSSDFLTKYWLRTQPDLAARFAPSSPYTNPPPRILLATTRYNCHKRGGTPIHVVTRKDVPLLYVLENAQGTQ